MSKDMAAPGLNPKGCVKAVARFNFRACDACVVRSGMKPAAVEFSPKTKPGKVPFISLCADAIVCGVSVGVGECFSENVPFSVGTWNQYIADTNYAQCLEEGDEGWEDPYEKGSVIPEGTVDLTELGVAQIPVGANGQGFWVPKDGLTLVVEFGKEELSDYTKGNAGICVEVCNP